MRMLLRTLKAAVLLLVVGTAASCAGYGGLGDVLVGDVFARDLTGEIRHVDVRRQTIELRTRDGRSARVDYDRRTQVEYAGRRYPVSALERGDYVSVRVRQDRSGRGYADRVIVRRNVRDTYGHDRARAAVYRLDGSVSRIDQRRGTFELRTRDRRTVQVVLPARVDRRTEDRFLRLRRGDTVRVEAVELSRNRLELRRFR
jgi:hypothetical protein